MERETLLQYIKNKYPQTFKEPNQCKRSKIKLSQSYSVPCIDKGFTTFYYWDTYFTNIGLIESGFINQARNNITTMRELLDLFGFVPNGDIIFNRSQPPLYTRSVYDFYMYTKDITIINENIDSIIKELQFWKYDRMTKCGLNSYGHNATNSYLLDFYYEMADRIDLSQEIVNDDNDRIKLASNLLSIAESGWDFNPRFSTKDSMYSIDQFISIELNCILLDAEYKASKMLDIVGRKEESKELYLEAENRKKLINSLLLDNDKIYKDYNYVQNNYSSIVSCASLYPFFSGASNDKECMLKILDKLEFDFGVSACEYRENCNFLQWDYPLMWPPTIYFIVEGLEKLDLKEDARRIAKKYIDNVESTFEKTGKLWEKYDSKIGGIGNNDEYSTPEMLGWTAGVYLYLTKKYKN